MALDLVAPAIPNGNDSKAPELFAQSFGTGLAAMARFAEMKRNSEMQLLKIAESEKMAQEQNELEREKMGIDAEIRRAALDSTMKLQNAQTDFFKARSKAFADGTATGLQRALARQAQERALAEEVNEHALELKLDDPNFATKEPVQFAANVLQFKDAWTRSPLPWVQQAIKKYQIEADQQKIPLKQLDGNGALSDHAKPTPIWQVVKNLQDPETKEATIAMLKANGHLSETTKKVPGSATKSWTRPIDSMWDAIIGPTDKTIIEETPSPALKQALEKGKDVKFERVPSRVPEVTSPKTSDAYETLPDPDLPPVGALDQPQASTAPKFEPTETDKVIAQAKAAVAQGAPAAAVAARLQEMGYDPSLLSG